MASAWTGSIRELKELIQDESYLSIINSQFSAAFYSTTDAEINSWKNSIPSLINTFSDDKFNDLQVIIELSMPIGAERADLILLGGTQEKPKAIIIELKQWSHLALNTETLEVDVPFFGTHQHPSLQAINYAGKLHFFNSRAHNYEIKSLVYLNNGSAADKGEISKGNASKLVDNCPIVTFDEIGLLCETVENFLLPCNLTINEGREFSNAPYKQSKHLFSFLRDHAVEIANNASLALANSGMGLTEEQENIVNEILRSLQSDEQIDFIIQGAPGSGKTMLAVSLLLRAAQKNIPSILAIRNNRLQAILKNIFDQAYPGISGMMMYFDPMFGVGISKFTGLVDLLVCDETQRMEKKIIPIAISKARISAIFLDETQRLNPPEQGTINNFTEASTQSNRKSEVYKLTSSLRVPGKYHEWVELLLKNPNDLDVLSIYQKQWKSGYVVKTHQSINEFISDLGQHKSAVDKVALVASFTESPGNNKASDPRNLRVGYPLDSGFDIYNNTKIKISWLMSTNDYQKFWIGGMSNELKRAASIYGAQGFETDFVGLIWGRDLIYRNGQWVLGDPNFCYDTIDRLITGQPPKRKWNDEALPLMINRYRIFLTRGIKGIHIFCEDEETRNHLRTVLAEIE